MLTGIGQGHGKGLPLHAARLLLCRSHLAALPTAAGLLRRLVPGRQRVAPLSPLQEERLEGLRRRLAATFSDEVAEHQVSGCPRRRQASVALHRLTCAPPCKPDKPPQHC